MHQGSHDTKRQNITPNQAEWGRHNHCRIIIIIVFSSWSINKGQCHSYLLRSRTAQTQHQLDWANYNRTEQRNVSYLHSRFFISTLSVVQCLSSSYHNSTCLCALAWQHVTITPESEVIAYQPVRSSAAITWCGRRAIWIQTHLKKNKKRTGHIWDI